MTSDIVYETNMQPQLLSDESSFGVFLIIMVVYILVFLAVYAVSSFLLGKIFKKAGVDSWKAWVPILNNWKILEMGGQKGFWAILTLFPVLNIVSLIFSAIAMHNINLKLGKDVGMTILAIFLPIVWLIIMAVSKDTWNDSLGAPRIDSPDFSPEGSQPTTVNAMPTNGFQAPTHPQQATSATPNPVMATEPTVPTPVTTTSSFQTATHEPESTTEQTTEPDVAPFVDNQSSQSQQPDTSDDDSQTTYPKV